MRYEPWLQHVSPKTGSVFVDIGANEGTWIDWALAQGFSQIHAFEPNPKMASILKKKFLSSAVIHPVGVWNSTTVLQFQEYEKSVLFSAKGIHANPVGTYSIPVEPLDSVLRDILFPISFIKIDVEGAEVEVLQGASNIINTHLPILLIEIHSIDNYRKVSKILSDCSYLLTIVRHPNYDVGSFEWLQHCWIRAEPNPYPNIHTLNLGCGSRPFPGATNLDKRKVGPWVNVVHDLEVAPWPFEDATFQNIDASFILEHVQASAQFVEECFRVLKPGGYLKIQGSLFGTDIPNMDKWITHTHDVGYAILDTLLQKPN